MAISRSSWSTEISAPALTRLCLRVLQIVSITEEEDGKKTFRQKGVHDMSKQDLQAVVKAAMATTDPDNSVYLKRLKERMDKCAAVLQ